jgi:tetratricopeptide (TPR) repeat protein
VTARALEGIALAAFYGGDMELARRSYEKALEVRIQRSGETHPKVSETLTALGSIAYTQGKSDEAEKYWLRSLAVDERILGPRHPDVAVTLNNLGRLDVERRNFARAKERLDNAVSIYAAQQSEAHEGQIFAWTNLALAHIGLEEYDAAEPLLERALRAADATKHRLEGPILTDLADLECRTRRIDDGLARLDAARPIIAERYPDDPWRVALVDNVRAGCLAKIGRAADAESLIASSMPVLIAKWPSRTYYGHDAVQRAAKVYTMTGNRKRSRGARASLTHRVSQDSRPCHHPVLSPAAPCADIRSNRIRSWTSARRALGPVSRKHRFLDPFDAALEQRAKHRQLPRAAIYRRPVVHQRLQVIVTTAVAERQVQHGTLADAVDVEDRVLLRRPVFLDETGRLAAELGLEHHVQRTVSLEQVNLIGRLERLDPGDERILPVRDRDRVRRNRRVRDEHRAERLHEMRREARAVDAASLRNRRIEFVPCSAYQRPPRFRNARSASCASSGGTTSQV